MNKKTKLNINNWALIFVGTLVLQSSLMLEFVPKRSYVWFHIEIIAIFTALLFYHLYLHFGFSNWFKRIALHKKPATKVLWWLLIAVMMSGVIAFVHWYSSHFHHSPIGGIHGKIGFLMLLVALGHLIKRRKLLK